MKLNLRKYQSEALDALDEAWKTYNRVACVLPTGMGKTVVFAHLIDRTLASGKRVLVLVHRDELAEQAAKKVHSVAPDATIGIVKAERNEVDAEVVIGSVQTLARPNRREQLDGIGLVVVDECHHAVARTWMEVLDHFGCFDSGALVGDDGEPYEPTPCAGFTATLTRDDGKGLGDVWETVAYERDIMYGIENNFLCDVRGKMVTVDGLDLATVARSRGDYQDGALGDALEASGAGEAIAKAYREHAADRRGILFAPTVATAESFADDLNLAGIVTEVITGETPKEERELAYKKFETGDVQVLSNCMVLTEGFDAPHASVAVIARPTSSAALYTQMVGRVLRTFPDKVDALVLDVVGVTGRHKLRSLTDLVKTEVRENESVKEARARLDREIKGRAGKGRISGAIGAVEVDLFASSRSVWLQTHGGIWFIPTREWTFVLWPDTDGTWRVGRKGTYQNRVTRTGEWLHRGLTLEYAMAWGEQLAEEVDPTVSQKTRSWRRSKPSQPQIDLALRYGIVAGDELETIRKGELSDRISVHVASRELDRAKAKPVPVRA